MNCAKKHRWATGQATYQLQPPKGLLPVYATGKNQICGKWLSRRFPFVTGASFSTASTFASLSSAHPLKPQEQWPSAREATDFGIRYLVQRGSYGFPWPQSRALSPSFDDFLATFSTPWVDLWENVRISSSRFQPFDGHHGHSSKGCWSALEMHAVRALGHPYIVRCDLLCAACLM